MIYGGYFDIDQKEIRLNELEKETNNVNFWDNKENRENNCGKTSIQRRKK